MFSPKGYKILFLKTPYSTARVLHIHSKLSGLRARIDILYDELDRRVVKCPLTPVSLLAIQRSRMMYAQATNKDLPDQSPSDDDLY
jgi:hypothetical protein